jgi:hypothetical protein
VTHYLDAICEADFYDEIDREPEPEPEEDEADDEEE